MGIPHATVVQLIEEGIDEAQDLAEFDRDNLTQVADNHRCADHLHLPRGRIPNPDPAAPAGATIAQLPFSFGAKAQKRLLAACDLVRYYCWILIFLKPRIFLDIVQSNNTSKKHQLINSIVKLNFVKRVSSFQLLYLPVCWLSQPSSTFVY